MQARCHAFPHGKPRPRFARWTLGIGAIAALACAGATCGALGVEGAQVPTAEVRRIWDAAPHNAFTDLARWKDRWLCVFREGTAHVSPDGAIRVLVSTDGSQWDSSARIVRPGEDLRDPKLSVTPDGGLMLIAAAAAPDDQGEVRHQTWAWISDDGRDWSPAVAIGEQDMWLWRVTWHAGAAWGVGYQTRGEGLVRLYRSEDGRQYDVVVNRLFEEGEPNESSLLFRPDGAALCLLRRDGGKRTGLVGLARPPYVQWQWLDLGVRIGGPHWIRLDDGRYVAALRLYDGHVRTSLAWLDVEQGTLTEYLELPSAGDSSYAGMVLHDGRLWVSYYSSHEGRTSIYLAKVPLPPKKDPDWEMLEPLFQPPAGLRDDFGTFRDVLTFEDGRQVTTPEEWQARRREILAAWHNYLGPWPALMDHPRLQVQDAQRREGFEQQRIQLEVGPGAMQEGWLLIPAGQPRFPAVVVPYYEPDTSIGLIGERRDFAYQLVRRGFVALAIGSPGGNARHPDTAEAACQPLSYLAYVAANCHTALAQHPKVDPVRIGIVGHSYGGKWAMFAACLYDKFAAAAWSDPGIVWDETRPNVNYWEPWYLGREPGRERRPGMVTPDNPRTGAYRELVAAGRDLHELHALLAPRPFFVSGGSEDPPDRWRALNHSIRVNTLLGYKHRVAMANRAGHDPTAESNAQIVAFFVHFLRPDQP